MTNSSIDDKAVKKIIFEITEKASLIDECEKRGIELTPAGQNRYKACCPFHDDKTPSFFVYDNEKPHYHCFGCSSHGGVFKFVSDIERIKDPSWSFKKTIDYFSSFLSISSSKDVSELDIRFFLQNSYDKPKKSKSLIPKLIISSEKIRRFLQNSSNPVRDLQEIGGTIKMVEEMYNNDYIEQMEEAIDRLGRLIDKSEMFRPEYDLLERSKNCKSCSFCSGLKKPVFGRGNIKSEIFIVGSFPNRIDTENSRVFSGKKNILEKLLLNKDITTNDYWLTNVVLCNGDKENIKEAEKCMIEHFNREVFIGKPKKIILLGSFVKNLLCPNLREKNIDWLAGKCVNGKIAGHNCKLYFNYSVDYIINTGGYGSPYTNTFKKTLFAAFEKEKENE